MVDLSNRANRANRAIVQIVQPCEMKHSLKDSHRFYGNLPKDCWELIGKRCKLTSQMKVAATCTKLRNQFFKQFSLNKWLTFIIKIRDYNMGLFNAAKGGHRNLIEFFIDNGADRNWGLQGAARGGHRDLVDFVISKGANSWSLGLYSAACGGHRDLAEFFIQKEKGHCDLVWARACASHGGHQDLVDFFNSKIGDHAN